MVVGVKRVVGRYIMLTSRHLRSFILLRGTFARILQYPFHPLPFPEVNQDDHNDSVLT